LSPSDSMTLKFRPEVCLGDKTFRKLCRANPDLRLERTAKGELVVMAPADLDGGNRNFWIAVRLGKWIEETGLGIGFDSATGFTLPNNAIRAPDAAWMTQERWDAVPASERKKFGHVVPDFVVELRSKSDRLARLRRKMQEYIEQGVRLGWLIDPKNGTVEISRPDRPVEILAHPRTLSGEDVLPAFTLDLKGILFD
jgi:Uma2 family endonuclease